MFIYELKNNDEFREWVEKQSPELMKLLRQYIQIPTERPRRVADEVGPPPHGMKVSKFNDIIPVDRKPNAFDDYEKKFREGVDQIKQSVQEVVDKAQKAVAPPEPSKPKSSTSSATSSASSTPSASATSTPSVVLTGAESFVAASSATNSTLSTSTSTSSKTTNTAAQPKPIDSVALSKAEKELVAYRADIAKLIKEIEDMQQKDWKEVTKEISKLEEKARKQLLADIKKQEAENIKTLSAAKSALSASSTTSAAVLQQRLNAARSAVEQERRSHWMEILRNQAEKQHEALNAEAHRIIDEQEQKLTAEYTARKNQSAAALYSLANRIASFETAFELQSEYEYVSHTIHQLSLSLLAVDKILSAKQSFSEEWESLKTVGKGDVVVETAVKSVPVHLTSVGVFSPSALTTHFNTLLPSIRTASYVRNETSIYQHILAKLFTMLTLNDGHNYYPNAVANRNDWELISNAQYHLAHGNLLGAVQQLSHTSPHVYVHVAQWCRETQNTLIVQQALDTIKARVTSLSVSFA